MKLSELLYNLEYRIIKGSIDVEVENISNDSRLVDKDSLFICIDGFETDGHRYIKDAIQKGAKAVIVQKEVKVTDDITVIIMENTRKALAIISGIYYNNPSKRFNLVGVTGTNGKTSTTYLIKNILENYNIKVGLIGTIQNTIGNEILNASRTTPESIELQKLFSDMVESNVNTVVMEVSSHALELHRVDGSEYDIGVFTNLTLDHLEFHKTMENYRDAKLKLFNMCKNAVINIDDEAGRYIIKNSEANNYITYGCNNNKATLNAKNIINKISGTSFTLHINGTDHLFKINTPGKFSVYNALAAIGVCFLLNIPIEIIKETLANQSTVKGRFQTLISKKGYYVVVDYAHTPDGLENVLDTILEVAEGKVITVFGCGGDRDRTKRPKMGKIAGSKSNYVIITSDNPRTENSEFIIKEIENGIKETKCSYEKITEREQAIIKALGMANKDDIILIAGKGHEDYQIIGNKKNHFDDIEKVEMILKKE